MKYKELDAFETNEFKRGDKVNIYNDGRVFIYFVVNVRNDIVIAAYKVDISEAMTSEFHFRQCRKLEEIKPREWLVRTDGQFSQFITSDLGMCPSKYTFRVREILEGE